MRYNFALPRWFCDKNERIEHSGRASRTSLSTDRSFLGEIALWSGERCVLEGGTRTHREAFLTASLARSFHIVRTRVPERVRCNFSTCTSGGRAATWYTCNLVTYVKHKFRSAVSTKCNGPADRPSAKSRWASIASIARKHVFKVFLPDIKAWRTCLESTSCV